MKKTIPLLGAVLALIIVGAVFVIWQQNQSTSDSTNETSSSQSTSQTSSQNSSDSSITSESTESSDPILKQIEAMTIEEKVGQLFLARYPGEIAVSDSQTYHIGGYLLFGAYFENETADSLLNKIQALQSDKEIPMFIGADEEGGTVTRISRNPNLAASPFQSPQAIYQANGWEGIAADAVQKAEILTSYGIQLGLFPVADVATDPNAFIYERTIGQDAKGTSTFVETVVNSLKETQVASTLKHFPGYGNNLDSHIEIVRDERPIEELRQNDFLPFQAGIKAGVDSILVSHNIVTSIDPDVPASISPKINHVLRDELGFNGVVMTDDMDMVGLADFISQEEAGLAALKAGNDLVLSSSYASQIPTVIEAVKSGEYSEDALDASVMRILKLKERLGMIE
ncbi:glycoside hydrolase family 3 protein [Enterococcus eurekensis]|uniref:beta-N-acetylhexosaminidase n=1 Tax=Enterococcus eurekensis TaxID=1159753 RepID=A0ABV9M298_9ENTE